MGITEILLLLLGIVAFFAGFALPAKKDKLHDADKKLGEKLVRELIEAYIKEMQVKITGTVDEIIAEGLEKAERSMERLTNEKIMAVNEYSDTVLEAIRKNHEEVVFLYDMLNDKHQNLKDTAVEVEKKVKEARESAEESVKEMEESAARAKEESVREFEEYAARAKEESVREVEESAARAKEESVRAVEESARAAWESARAALQQVKDAEAGTMNQIQDAKAGVVSQIMDAQASALAQIKNAEGSGHTIVRQTEEPEIPSFVPRQLTAEPEPAESEKTPEEAVPVKEEPPKKRTAKKTVKPAVKPAPVKEVPADLPEVDISFASAGEDGKNNNEKILALHKAGKSNMAIAKELGLGIGEVKLVIGLFKGV